MKSATHTTGPLASHFPGNKSILFTRTQYFRVLQKTNKQQKTTTNTKHHNQTKRKSRPPNRTGRLPFEVGCFIFVLVCLLSLIWVEEGKHVLLFAQAGCWLFFLLPAFCLTPNAMEILGRSEGKGGRATHPAGSPLLPLFLPLSSCQAGEHVSVAAGLNAVQGNIFFLLFYNIYTYAHIDLCVTAGLPAPPRRCVERVASCGLGLLTTRAPGSAAARRPPHRVQRRPQRGKRGSPLPPGGCRTHRVRCSRLHIGGTAANGERGAGLGGAVRGGGGSRRGRVRRAASGRGRGAQARGDTRRSTPALAPLQCLGVESHGRALGGLESKSSPQPGQAPCAERGDGCRPGESENCLQSHFKI